MLGFCLDDLNRNKFIGGIVFYCSQSSVFHH